MGLLRDIHRKYRVAQYFSAAQQQALYAQVAEEVAENNVIPGLWAMALAKGEGEESKAKAKYLELRVEMLKQEHALAEEMFLAASSSEKADREAERMAEKRKLEEEALMQKTAAMLEHERSVSEFLEEAGYSVEIQNTPEQRTYRVTEPKGASIGFETLRSLASFAAGRGFRENAPNEMSGGLK